MRLAKATMAVITLRVMNSSRRAPWSAFRKGPEIITWRAIATLTIALPVKKCIAEPVGCQKVRY
jgi:hypothetical protein